MKEKEGSDVGSREGARAHANLSCIVAVVSVLVVIAASASAIAVSQLPPTHSGSASINESTAGADTDANESSPSADVNESTTSSQQDANGSDIAELNYSVISDIRPMQESAAIEVNKTVWDPVNKTWVDEICCAKICDNYTFNCTIHNTGNVILQNITFWDIASCSLEYAGNMTVRYNGYEYHIPDEELGEFPFKPKILHPVNLSWDPHEPICNEFEELCPEPNKSYHIIEWEDTNHDGNLSYCDQINMTDEAGNASWYHVELLPYTLNVTNETTGKTMFIDSELDHQYIDLTNPNGTQWKEVCCCKDSYNLTAWYDTNPDGVLNASDHILLRNKRTGEETWYHVEEVTIDLVVSREWTIDDYCPGLLLPPGGKIHIEADVHVVRCGHDCNTQYVKAKPDGGGDWIYANDSACIDVCCIEAEKKVWNGSAWADEVAAELNDTVRFKIYVHNNGACNFTNIVVNDTLSDSLDYINATPTADDVTQNPDGSTTVYWNFTRLAPCEDIIIEFNATVVKCPGVDTNTVNVTAWCDQTTVSDEDTAKVAVMPTPFHIFGWVKYSNGTEVLGPKNVTVKNQRANENYTVETNASYSYYQVITSSCNVSASDVLNFSADDGVNSTDPHEVTVKTGNMTDGGLFEQNLTIVVQPPGICGDVVGEDGLNWGDAMRLMYNRTYPGDPRFPLSSVWAGDVVGNDGLNWGDAMRLMYNRTYPGDPRFPLNCP